MIWHGFIADRKFVFILLIGVLTVSYRENLNPSAVTMTILFFSFQQSCLGTLNRGVPLCFPGGWPRGYPIPQCGCYQPGWANSWRNPNVACLVPIINGRRIPPCYGRWVQNILSSITKQFQFEAMCQRIKVKIEFCPFFYSAFFCVLDSVSN